MVVERNPIMVLIYSMCTCGIYAIYWFYKTAVEMNEVGAKIPAFWWYCIPGLNIYWLYKYAEEWSQVTKSTTSGIMMFVIFLVFSPAGMYMVQVDLNKLAAKPAKK